MLTIFSHSCRDTLQLPHLQPPPLSLTDAAQELGSTDQPILSLAIRMRAYCLTQSFPSDVDTYPVSGPSLSEAVRRIQPQGRWNSRALDVLKTII